MSPVVIISAVVLFNLIQSAKGSAVPDVTDEVTFDITSSDQNFTTQENVKLHLKAKVDSARIIQGTCSMTCSINKAGEITASKCEVMVGNDQTLSIDAVSNRIVTRKDNGTWDCTFIVKHRSVGTDGTLTTGSIPQLYSFQLNIKTEDTPIIQNWIKILVGVVVLVLIIFIGQTICIIHFKRQAKVVRRQAKWTSKRGSTEDIVRYSKMPVQKIKVEQCPESRESGIYEVLDNARAVLKPVPPPLTTLPRKDTYHNSTPLPVEPQAEAINTTRTLTNGMVLPFTNSLLRKKAKKPKQPKDTDSIRSSTDRIKERPPLPLPSDEVYEVMESSPTPPRKEYKTNEVQKKEEFRGFNTARPIPTRAPVDFGSGSQSLQSQAIPSKLKEELRKRVNTVLLDEPRQRQLLHKATPYNPVLPPVSPAKLSPPIPRPEKSTTSTPNLPMVPKPSTVPVVPKASNVSVFPKPSNVSVYPKTSTVPIGPKPTSTPVGPKPSTPAPMVPKAKPSPPVKPKQLHPLPPTPQGRPESIHVITEGGGYDSDEDWTYETLPTYPIYSI